MMILTLTLLMPKSEFIASQKKICKSGESLLEATPQFCLQMFIVLRTMNPSWKQNFSLTCSALSIPVSNVDTFLESNGQALGLNTPTLETFIRICPNALFRVLSFSILIVFFEFIVFGIFGGYSFLWLVCAWIIYRSYHIESKDWVLQCLESCYLSPLTVTNLGGPTQAAAIFRLASTYFNFIFYTISLCVVVFICNTHPESANVLGYIFWADLAIVQDIYYLNLVVFTTISMGLMSFLLDILLVWTLGYQSECGTWGWDWVICQLFLDAISSLDIAF